MGSFSGADESSLRRLIDQHKGAAKKKLSLPTSVREIKRMLLLEMKVSRTALQACAEKKDLIDLYVKQLSNKDIKAVLKVNMQISFIFDISI